MTSGVANEQGSVWRKWDLHLHTPASFQWKGEKLRGLSGAARDSLLDAVINAINAAEPAAVAIMDYWTFDGYLAIRARSGQPGAPTLNKTVFPGIELRLQSPTTFRLNVHVILSDRLTAQELGDFKGQLNVALSKRPLSDECLVDFARKHLGDDKLSKHGFKRTEIDSSEECAYLAGAKTAEIDPASFVAAYESMKPTRAVVLMPWDTSDGLRGVNWIEHYSYVRSMLNVSPVFESRDSEARAAFVGEETPANKQYFAAFQSALNSVPRLVVSGTDAHSLVDYGKYPSGKATWIKAEPTFLGLLQAIKEPAKRSFVGDRPEKLCHVEANRTAFVSKVSIAKVPGSLPGEQWFDKCTIPLNHDLVAIIGNKGSGKSALADILALAGDTRNSAHFTFLTSKRFRKAPQNRAQHFRVALEWETGTTSPEKSLAENPHADAVERIKYIPQEFFEQLCNEHVRGESSRFEEELEKVIFSHIGPTERLGCTSFGALTSLREREITSARDALRLELSTINKKIEALEKRELPEVGNELANRKALKQSEIDEHDKLKPIAVPAPAVAGADANTSKRLAELADEIQGLAAKRAKRESALLAATSRVAAVARVEARLAQLKRNVTAAGQEIGADLAVLGLTFDELVELKVRIEMLSALGDKLADEIAESENDLNADIAGSVAARLAERQTQRATLAQELDTPARLYQEYLAASGAWAERRLALVGSSQDPGTLDAINAELESLKGIPAELAEMRERRKAIAREIHKSLQDQRMVREGFFAPVQGVIDSSTYLKDDYRLQFQSGLFVNQLEARFFEFVKQNTGSFRGDDDGKMFFQKIVEKHNFAIESEAIKAADEILDATVRDMRSDGQPAVAIAKMLRASKASSDLYDLLYGFEYLEPRYSLLFQDTDISLLSPGQRGALLLVFYLLADKDQAPIVLDQPEENLDNETVVGLLVPVVVQAKKSRQIVMVTHNPNLAVVCDAEQVIHASFSRADDQKIRYTSGAIEDPKINRLVVDVLEGTKRAFDNRANKYHE